MHYNPSHLVILQLCTFCVGLLSRRTFVGYSKFLSITVQVYAQIYQNSPEHCCLVTYIQYSYLLLVCMGYKGCQGLWD